MKDYLERRRERQQRRQDEYDKKLHDATVTARESDAESETERLAAEVLTMREIAICEAENLSPANFLREEYDVDPAEYGNDQTLLAAVSASQTNKPVNDPVREQQARELRVEKERKRIESNGKVTASSSEEKVEAIADAALTSRQAYEADKQGVSAREYIRENFGIEAERYDNDSDLLGAISAVRREE